MIPYRVELLKVVGLDYPLWAMTFAGVRYIILSIEL